MLAFTQIAQNYIVYMLTYSKFTTPLEQRADEGVGERAAPWKWVLTLSLVVVLLFKSLGRLIKLCRLASASSHESAAKLS